MRRVAPVGLVVVSCLVLAACAATTDPPSNVSSTSAALNARGRTDSTPAHFYFQYSTAKNALATGFGLQTPTRAPVAANLPGGGRLAPFS